MSLIGYSKANKKKINYLHESEELKKKFLQNLAQNVHGDYLDSNSISYASQVRVLDSLGTSD